MDDWKKICEMAGRLRRMSAGRFLRSETVLLGYR